MNPIQSILNQAGIENVVVRKGKAIIPCGSEEIELTQQGARFRLPSKGDKNTVYTSGYFKYQQNDGSLDVGGMADYISFCRTSSSSTPTTSSEQFGSVKFLNSDGSEDKAAMTQYLAATRIQTADPKTYRTETYRTRRTA